MEHSKYQEAIFQEIQYGKSNLLIKAVAGSGKTYTIVESLKLISPTKSSGFFAFNSHIAEELKHKCPSYVDVSTLHSAGWRYMHIYYGGCKLVPNKMFHYCERLLSHKIPKPLRMWYFFTICKMLDLLRLNVLTRKKDLIEVAEKHNFDLVTEELIDDAMTVFLIACEDTKQFDFTDMIYIPAILNDIKVKLYDYLFVDEGQDLSTASQLLIERMVKKKTGRTIIVGDPKQAIYGFAGSDVKSFNKLETKPNTMLLPLSVSYRCAKNIVYKAQEIVDYIEPYDKSPEGIVREEGSILNVRKGDWVLCRNVRPLIILYVDLLRQGKRAFVKGEDIGKTLITLLKQTKENNTKTAIDKLMSKLRALKNELKSKGIQDVDRHPKVGRLQELISVIMFLSDKYKTITSVIDVIGKMFKDKGEGITLSTIHKSKGLENDRVFIICPELIPSRYATQKWQLEQEQNLLYVAYTRAKKELVIVTDFNDSVDDFMVELRKNKKKITKLT